MTNTQQCQLAQDQPRKASLDFSGFQTTFLGQQHTVTPNQEAQSRTQVGWPCGLILWVGTANVLCKINEIPGLVPFGTLSQAQADLPTEENVRLPLCFKWPRKPLLGPLQAMLLANKNPVSTDLVTNSGFAATQLGKLVCELSKTRGQLATPEVSSSMWYILRSKIVVVCSNLTI